jgi:preprotein translocase SecE subunit
MSTVKTEGFIGRVIKRVRTWFSEVTAELKRVTKPTPEETTQMMLVVIGFILVVGLWFVLWDVLLAKVTESIDKWVQQVAK